jgi:hypothetical protein
MFLARSSAEVGVLSKKDIIVLAIIMTPPVTIPAGPPIIMAA